MTIKNETKWSTEDLRKMISEAIKRVKKIEGNKYIRPVYYAKYGQRWIKHLIEIKTRRERNCSGVSGKAGLGYGYIKLSIGNEWQPTEEGKKILAYAITHEYYHNIGVKKIDGRKYQNDWTKDFDYSWVNNYQIREKDIKPNEKVIGVACSNEN